MKVYSLLFVLMITGSFANGQEGTMSRNSNNEINNAFVQNKGQLRHQSNVLYYFISNNLKVSITNKGLSYSFIKIKGNKEKVRDSSATISVSQIDMNLVDAIISSENIEQLHPRKNTSNFFFENCPKGITNVGSYDTILIRNIYEGIDWRIYLNGKGVKYDFLLQPGADAQRIRMRFPGADSIRISNDRIELQLYSALGEMRETNLTAFVTNNLQLLECKYRLKGTELSYEINIPQGVSVTIDPPLLWSTYFGGNDVDWVNKMCVDSENNLFITGLTWSNNIPVVNPATGVIFQGSLINAYDIFLTKYDSARQLVWSTYLGSSGYDDPRGGLCIDGSDHIYLVGLSGNTDFPLINTGGGMYFQGAVTGGFWDVLIATFDNNGFLFRSTFYGGNDIDEPRAAVLDGLGNLYITGEVQSSNFPTFNPGNGAFYQPSIGSSSNWDVFLLKFDTCGVRKWATFMGGSNPDIPGDIAVNSSGEIFVCAGTNSPTTLFPLANPGGNAYYYSGPASSVGVLIKFGLNNNLIWSTTIGPVSSAVYFSKIKLDKWNRLYVVGTSWATDCPVVDPAGGAFVQAYPNSISACVPIILEFNDSLEMEWSTPLLGSGVGGFYSVDIDTNGNVFAVGTQDSYTEQVVNPGGGSFFQQYNAGAYDVFIAKFFPSHARQWVTFFGGSNDEEYGANSFMNNVLIDKNQHMLFMGTTRSTNLPLKNRGNGAYIDSTFNGGNSDAFILEFGSACETPNAPTSLTSSSSAICVGDTVTLTAAIVTASTQYIWTISPGINFINQGNTNTQSVAVNNSGNVCVNVSNGCGSSSATCINLSPNIPSGTIPFSDTTVCPGDTVRINLLLASDAIWLPGTYLSDSSSANTVSIPFENIIYHIIITDNNGCITNDSLMVIVRDSCIIPSNCNWGLFPNPAPGFVNFFSDCPLDSLSNLKLRLYDVLGQIVYENLNLASGANDLNHFELANAMYFYVICDEKEILKSGKILNMVVH